MSKDNGKEIVKVESALADWPKRAQAIVVKDQGSYDEAVEQMVGLGKLQKAIDAHHDPIIQSANQTHKTALAAKNKFSDLIKFAKNIISGKLGVWLGEQKRIQAEQQRLLDEKAAAESEEQKLEEAIVAGLNGASDDTVKAIMQEEVAPSPATAPPTFLKSSAVAAKTNWSAEVFSLWELAKAVGNKSQPENYIIGLKEIEGKEKLYTSPTLNKIAVALKDALSIPGVRAVGKPSVVGTGR